ncbi:uncharacterized protein LOC110729029 [Chenopodium quinoa]|uniref:uncharacterized protein LOC110729029 n=1 Tax=Chenopodium quinoa TaxID=63459 RepID=UPI000B7842D4|nr:uncharacterized protein LOC110729029 [Chenopodium quinoa]
MRWHDEERSKDDKVLSHPADSEAWKSFDTRYPVFGGESRNVRLGLASDGFNPFGMLSSTYSCSSHRNDVYEYTIEGNKTWKDCSSRCLPDGQRIVVEVNKENQPIGDEGGVLGYFCGTVARNGSLCSLTYTRWDLLKKGCNKNNQKLILQEVERRFLYPKALGKWILKSIGHKWRDYKGYLKGKGYDDDTDVNTLYDNCPDDDVDYDQWKRSKRSKESHAKAKVKPIHTTGTKSHARVREEMKKNLNKSPSRTQVYLQCHQHESEADITNQIKKVATEQGDQEDLDDDPASKVLGKDQYGRVRGLGLGVKPSDVGESSYPRFCNGLKMSSDNEAAIIHYFRRLKDKVNRLRHRVRKQAYNMTKVKRTLEDHDILVTLVSETESETDSLASESDEYPEAEDDDDQDVEASPRANNDINRRD